MRCLLSLALCLAPALLLLAAIRPAAADADVYFSGHVSNVIAVKSTTYTPAGKVSENTAMERQYAQAFAGSFLIVRTNTDPMDDWVATLEQIDSKGNVTVVAPPLAAIPSGADLSATQLSAVQQQPGKLISWCGVLYYDFLSQTPLPPALTLHLVEVDADGTVSVTDAFLVLESP